MVLPDHFILYIKDILAFIGVLIITCGALRSALHLIVNIVYTRFSPNFIRLQFGNSVLLGLEFMVAGDIVGSLVKPNYYNLGMLAIIVLIRTVLSFFLNRELEALSPEQRNSIK